MSDFTQICDIMYIRTNFITRYINHQYSRSTYSKRTLHQPEEMDKIPPYV